MISGIRGRFGLIYSWEAFKIFVVVYVSGPCNRPRRCLFVISRNVEAKPKQVLRFIASLAVTEDMLRPVNRYAFFFDVGNMTSQ